MESRFLRKKCYGIICGTITDMRSSCCCQRKTRREGETRPHELLIFTLMCTRTSARALVLSSAPFSLRSWPFLCVPTAAGHSDGRCWCFDLLGVLFRCPLETQCKNFHAISVVLTLAFFSLKNISCTSFHRRWTSVGWWVIQQLCKSFMVVHQTLPSFFPKLT